MDRIDLQLLQPHGSGRAGRRRYSVRIARGPDEVRAAQRLRWRVFADELGARLPTRVPGVDQDIFDAHCEHLTVSDDDTGEVVGTCRILAPDAARRIGGYYSDNEFDLTRLRLLRERMVEIGRSCIDPDHRNGAVIALIWTEIARYILSSGNVYLAGCVSMSMTDGGHCAASIFEQLRVRNLSPAEYRVSPRHHLPLDDLEHGRAIEVPTLIRTYLRAGAWVCGAPAWNPDFNTADFFMFLPLARLNLRHARHFFGEVLPVG